MEISEKLCHSCYQRNSESNLDCEHCGACLKEQKSNHEMNEILKLIAERYHQNRVHTTLEFTILLFTSIYLSFQLLILAIEVTIYEHQMKSYMNTRWYIGIMYLTSFISFMVTMRLIRRKKSARILMFISIPFQLIIFTKLHYVIYRIREDMYDLEEIPHFMYIIDSLYIPLMIYSLVLSVIFALQLYFITFNPQVKQCLN